MGAFLLGLDFGTGGAKGCIINDLGYELGYAYREYPIIQPKPGWAEHDPLLYWNAACEIIEECISQAGISAGMLKGIAVSAALPSLVMIDRQGVPIHNAYNLLDRRATKEVQWLKDTIGEEKIFSITANRLDDHPVIANLLWEKNNRPEGFQRIFKALTIEGYIVFKFTGAYTLVHSNAGFFGVAYNIVEKQFDYDLLEQIGIDSQLLPSLYYCEDIVGTVQPQAALDTGLAAGIPVAAGQADFNASCISVGIIEEGDCQINLGTCGVLGIIHKNIDFKNEMIALGFTVDPESTYMAIGATQTGGMSLRYIRDNLARAESEAEKHVAVNVYELLSLEAEKAPPGSEGLIVLPYLTGEKSPIWDPFARGCIFGLSLHHSKGHIIRAMMEGVIYALYDSYRLFQDSGDPINTPIVMNEGGAESRLWRRIISDVFNVPTVFAKRRSGAPFGDAVLAGVATGIFKDFMICKRWAEYVDRIEPDSKNNALYMEYFHLYKKIYDVNKPLFRGLAAIRDGAGAH